VILRFRLCFLYMSSVTGFRVMEHQLFCFWVRFYCIVDFGLDCWGSKLLLTFVVVLFACFCALMLVCVFWFWI